MFIFKLAYIILLLCNNISCDAFSIFHASSAPFPRVVTLHETKRNTSKAKGFGKKENYPSTPSTRFLDDTEIESSSDLSAGAGSDLSLSVGEKQETVALSPEERTKQILRDKYGMKTIEEQQLDAVQDTRRKEEQKRWSELKRKAEAGDDFDLFAILPTPVTIGIDRFLKAGTVLCGILFVASGILIAVEAWSKASGDPLSPDLDDFIVRTVEPNFTPGLLVLLSFSISLGLFASLQLGSQGASYKEK
jgi:hypothetical protein